MDTLIRSLVDINEADNEAATNNKHESGNWKYFGNLTRYVVLTIRQVFTIRIIFKAILFSTLCLSFVLGNALAFNFTVICMTKSTVDSQSDYGHNLPNFTNVNRNELLKQEPIFSTRERNWIFSAVPAGALVGQQLAYIYLRIYVTILDCRLQGRSRFLTSLQHLVFGPFQFLIKKFKVV